MVEARSDISYEAGRQEGRQEGMNTNDNNTLFITRCLSVVQKSRAYGNSSQ
jgi:hypothetical protein